MKSLQLNFSQKIWLGFGIIIFLLSLSSAVSLYNLFDISDSTTQVNESAVPVLKQSNQAQITLLKQAKLSSSGYNALNELEIQQFTQEFDLVAKTFNEQYGKLKQTVLLDAEMSELVKSGKEHYASYNEAVVKMFEAKQALLKAQSLANEELRSLSNMVDDAGAFLLDVVWTEYGDDDKSRELMEGIQGRLDGLIIGLFNVVDEINRSSDLEFLQGSGESIAESLSGIQVRSGHAEKVLPDLSGRETWVQYLQTLEDIKVRATAENGLSALKVKQIEQTKLARQYLNESEQAVRNVVVEFDSLLLAADTLFNTKQDRVLEKVDLGSKAALLAWVILIFLASQNFNSMRKSIKKKMADLAKLNSTGEVLASLLDKNKALEEVLAAMHEQVGVAQGSVYLMNDEQKLEVKAFYPPKQINQDQKPAQFSMGEGILGQAAENKNIIFVPNTEKDTNFVSQKGAAAKALLCVPLVDKDVLIGVMNFSGDVKEVNFEDSDYEFASSIARLLITTIKNIRMRETIEEQNRTLEQKVRERTAELKQKNEDVAVMMANLHQGLFTIMAGGVVHHEYSKHLEDILETKNIASRNFMDLLFSNCDLGGDEANQVATAISSLLGSDEMMFDFNAHLLVTEVVMNMKSGKQKIIELDWVPIVDKDTDEIDKIMVTIKDVTELRALQLEAESQKKELEIIGQILSITIPKFKGFVKTSHEFINKCRALINSTETKDKDVIAHLFRYMHTVKGNARTYGFKYVTDSVHQVEHTYDELRKNDEKEWCQKEMLDELLLAEKDIQFYVDIANEKLGEISDSDDSINSGDINMIQQLIEEASQLDFANVAKPVKEWVGTAYNTLAQNFAQPMSEIIDPVVNSVYSLSGDLGKEKPVVKIDDGNVLIKAEVHGLLNDVFMHVFRNAMDHGIETAEERLQKGKSEKGTIDFTTIKVNENVVFEIKDDGKGMAIEHLYTNAVKNGIYTENQPRPPAQEIANLVFHSGFSTAKEVTDISGRGVGMDAVKQFIQDAGGSIEVVLEPGDDNAEFRSFITRLKLPASCCLSRLSLA
jgi:putative methionine-R-sulfoxide reductase with GAF domain/signal transduction histidine kinase